MGVSGKGRRVDRIDSVVVVVSSSIGNGGTIRVGRFGATSPSPLARRSTDRRAGRAGIAGGASLTSFAA